MPNDDYKVKLDVLYVCHGGDLRYAETFLFSNCFLPRKGSPRKYIMPRRYTTIINTRNSHI
ncbi:hypothetical protein MOUN0_O00232 [Monosporozyma unispora]